MKSIGIRLAGAGLGLLAPLSCAGPGANYPPDTIAITCTNAENDCGDQAKRACPSGFKTIDTKSWTVREETANPNAPDVTHNKLVIKCE